MENPTSTASEQFNLSEWLKEIMVQVYELRNIQVSENKRKMIYSMLNKNQKFNPQAAEEWILYGNWRGKKELDLSDFFPDDKMLASTARAYYTEGQYVALKVENKNLERKVTQLEKEIEQYARKETKDEAWSLYKKINEIEAKLTIDSISAINVLKNDIKIMKRELNLIKSLLRNVRSSEFSFSTTQGGEIED